VVLGCKKLTNTSSAALNASVPPAIVQESPHLAALNASVPPAIVQESPHLAAESVPPAAESVPPASRAVMSVPEAIVQGSPHQAAQNASVPPAVYQLPAGWAEMTVPEAIVQESPHLAAESVPHEASPNASVPQAIVQESQQGPWWTFILDPTWITIVAGMTLLMQAGEWLVKPGQPKCEQPELSTARCDKPEQQELVAAQVAAVCPLVPSLVPFAGPVMLTGANSNDEIKLDKATQRWQCEFHDWVHMLWHSKEWFDSNADTPVGGWAFESQHGQAHGDPEFGDVVISRQEFARLLWRCESMGDRPPVCQWIAPDECPEDIWWRA